MAERDPEKRVSGDHAQEEEHKTDGRIVKSTASEHREGRCCCHEHEKEKGAGKAHGHGQDHEHDHRHHDDHACCEDEECCCGHHHGESDAAERRKTLVRILAGIALLIMAWLAPLQGIWKFLVFLVPYLVVGWDTLLHAARGILRGRVFDEAFLMSIASVGALCIGEYPEAVAVMLFNQIGELFEDTAVDKSRDAIRDLMDIRPDHANVERDGQLTAVSPEEVQPGEILVVKPGERIPLDGEVVDGSSSVDTSSLTGEAEPRTVSSGDAVISGCINRTGVLRIRSAGTYAESTVSRVLELVEEAGDRKARTESMITRFARWYTPAVCLLAVLVCAVPTLLFAQPFAVWLRRALIFLVISCPCALVLSVPLAFFAGIGCASGNGILIKGSNLLEALCSCDTMVLDKTGTLTKGKMEVIEIMPVQGSGKDLLKLAAHAEAYSSHPIAQAIREAFGYAVENARCTDVREEAGYGVEAVVDGKKVHVGNGRLMRKAVGKEVHLENGCVGVAAEGEFIGSVRIGDQLKNGAEKAIAELKELGVRRMVMLTGDRKETADQIAVQAGLDEVYASLLPQDKVYHVERMLAEKPKDGCLAFVGDGVNDAPVLARADVGIAMGALGSDAAVEAADVVLMDDDPARLPLAVRIARRTRKIARQNIAFALGVKMLIMVLGVLGIADMWLAVFADVGVSVLAVLNATRAMRPA